MGTRRFYSIEEENSRIKWEKADKATAKKLRSAIKNPQIYKLKSTRGIGPSIIFLIFPILLLLFYLFLIAESQPFYMHIVVVCAVSFFFFTYLITRYLKTPPRPRFNLENYDIWIKRAKCTDIFTSGIGSDEQYFAAFNIGRVHVSLRLYRFQYKANPVGEEYIFFKFNNKHGNPWQAVSTNDIENF